MGATSRSARHSRLRAILAPVTSGTFLEYEHDAGISLLMATWSWTSSISRSSSNSVSQLRARSTRPPPSAACCTFSTAHLRIVNVPRALARCQYDRIVTDNTVFPKYDVLGWYSTGADVLPSDTAIHDKARASTGNVDRAPKAHRADPFGAAIAARTTALCAISDRGVQRKPSVPSLRHRCLSDYEGPAHEGAQTTCGRYTTDGCSDKMHVGMQII